jgi:ubiquinone/menaquinone biosynthesis C-methylase UbiE
MRDKNRTPQQIVGDYFNSLESRLGYALLLQGRKHFGYYPAGKEQISTLQAQLIMENQLAKRLALPGGSEVLDAGCGEGKVAIHLAQEWNLRVTGVDLLKWAIRNAWDNSRSDGMESRTSFKIMDYTELDFPDESFDGIYTMETLVHVPDYHEALCQLYRVLKPGGKAVLFEYSVSPEWDIPVALRDTWSMVIEQSGMHSLPHFSHGAFPRLLGTAGFVNIAVEDVTTHVLPMLDKFHSYARYPYQLIRAFGLQRRFINTVAGYISRELAETKAWRYNIISADKPALL